MRPASCNAVVRGLLLAVMAGIMLPGCGQQPPAATGTNATSVAAAGLKCTHLEAQPNRPDVDGSVSRPSDRPVEPSPHSHQFASLCRSPDRLYVNLPLQQESLRRGFKVRQLERDGKRVLRIELQHYSPWHGYVPESSVQLHMPMDREPDEVWLLYKRRPPCPSPCSVEA